MGPFNATWLAAAISLSIPLILAGTGEVVSERGGIINIGLEGMMLSGAFFSYLTSWLLHSFWLGVRAGIGAGLVLGAVMALLSIQARANQIVVGVGIDVLALGVTTFMYEQIFSTRAQIILPIPKPFNIPGLSRIPGIGSALFGQTPLGYIGFALVLVAWIVMFKTSWGLALRAAGELPAAADTAGASVQRIRWIGALVAGGAAGLAGAFLSIGQLGLFTEQISAGRGDIALAAVTFGGWNPGLGFGSADALQLSTQAEPVIPRQVWLALAILAMLYIAWSLRPRARRSLTGLVVGIGVVAGGIALFAVPPHITLPPQLWLSIPYILALLALAGVVGKVRMPSALAVPYRRGGAP